MMINGCDDCEESYLHSDVQSEYGVCKFKMHVKEETYQSPCCSITSPLESNPSNFFLTVIQEFID